MPTRIHEIQRIVPTVGIPIHTITITDGVGLEESTDVWIIISGTVIVKPCFIIEPSTGEHVGIYAEFGILGRHLAIDAVLVALAAIAGGIG
jgi:hypothetical protein